MPLRKHITIMFHSDLVIYFFSEIYFFLVASFTTHKLMQYLKDGSLCRRHNLTLVSNVCEAVPISLFWAPNGLQISFHLHWQMDNGSVQRKYSLIAQG